MLQIWTWRLRDFSIHFLGGPSRRTISFCIEICPVWVSSYGFRSWDLKLFLGLQLHELKTWGKRQWRVTLVCVLAGVCAQVCVCVQVRGFVDSALGSIRSYTTVATTYVKCIVGATRRPCQEHVIACHADEGTEPQRLRCQVTWPRRHAGISTPSLSILPTLGKWSDADASQLLCKAEPNSVLTASPIRPFIFVTFLHAVGSFCSKNTFPMIR